MMHLQAKQKAGAKLSPSEGKNWAPATMGTGHKQI